MKAIVRPAMLIKSACLIALAGASLAALPAAAQTAGSDRRLAASETRQGWQETRIASGVASGSINANEAARLDARQGRIDNSQQRLAADGNFSRRDHVRVSHRQNHVSRSIGRARFNRH